MEQKNWKWNGFKTVKEAVDANTGGLSDEMSAVSDGVIVGSAIIKLIAQYRRQAPARVGEFVKSMKDNL